MSLCVENQSQPTMCFRQYKRMCQVYYYRNYTEINSFSESEQVTEN